MIRSGCTVNKWSEWEDASGADFPHATGWIRGHADSTEQMVWGRANMAHLPTLYDGNAEINIVVAHQVIVLRFDGR